MLGTSATTAQSNFEPDHPLYREIAELARIRTSHRALTRGLQLIRYSQDKPGLFAVSRFDPASGREMLLLFNTSTAPVDQNVRVETRSRAFHDACRRLPGSRASARQRARRASAARLCGVRCSLRR